jgi:quercetin dioxygenase-like cupin family protein
MGLPSGSMPGASMQVHRSRPLQDFLDATRLAIAAADPPSPSVPALAGRIFGALQQAALQAPENRGARLPACSHLTAALGTAREAGDAVAAVAEAFAAIEPGLAWGRRAGAEQHGAGFAENHANTTIVGPGGLELREDVLIGATVLGPGLQYPDHHHPPEEMYLVLSAGSWRRGDEGWRVPGPGSLVFTPSNAVHSMLAADTPLFAIWFLWTEGRSLTCPARPPAPSARLRANTGAGRI